MISNFSFALANAIYDLSQQGVPVKKAVNLTFLPETLKRNLRLKAQLLKGILWNTDLGSANNNISDSHSAALMPSRDKLDSVVLSACEIQKSPSPLLCHTHQAALLSLFI